MRKKICQISLILLAMIISFLLVFITQSNAESIAGLNCPSSVKIGDELKISLILPKDAFAAQAKITVKWSDGKESSQTLVYTSGLADNSVSFPTTFDKSNVSEGKATVSATNIIITASNEKELENGGSKTATVNVIASSSETQNDNNNNNNNNNNNSQQVTFTDVNETVYTTDRVNIRSTYSTSGKVIKTVNAGTALTRTGVGNNGWSRINYDGQTAYISSQYVTTTNPSNTTDDDQQNDTDDTEEVTFKDVDETMYASQNCNLRKSWSTSSEKVGYLKKGEQVKRTGVADNGWSRIDYGGKVMYVATRLLTSEEPKDESDSQNQVTDENSVENETSEEKTELGTIQEEIGVLPEVGDNIAVKIYIVLTIMAIVGVFSGIYYIKKFK